MLEVPDWTLTDVGPAFEELALAVLLAAAEEATFDDEAAALAELAFTGLLIAAGETLDVAGGAIDELTLAALDATEAATFEELLGLAGPTLEEGLALDEVGATEAEAEAILDELATAAGVELA